MRFFFICCPIHVCHNDVLVWYSTIYAVWVDSLRGRNGLSARGANDLLM